MTRNGVNKWTIGSQLLKKYQLTFNQDKKLIGCYFNKTNVQNISRSLSLPWSIVIIFGLIIVILLITLYYYIKVYRTRKKKANEMSDEYEYDNKSNKGKEIILMNLNSKYSEL